MDNTQYRKEKLQIVLSQLDQLSHNEKALELLKDDAPHYPLLEGLEKCAIYEFEELLLLGTDYTPTEDQKFRILSLWENGGDKDITTLSLNSGEHKLTITYNNQDDEITFTGNKDETNELLKKYLIARSLHLI